MMHTAHQRSGLYLPQFEHDSCGVGFIADICGRRSHAIVDDALELLVRMSHRGATGAEQNTGDGAGILTQIPDTFFREQCSKLGFDLPAAKEYAVGMVFLPQNASQRRLCEEVLERTVAEEGAQLIGWRDVPIDDSAIGATAKASQPFTRQIFIAGNGFDNAAFERKLFIIRRWTKELITRLHPELAEQFYFASLSTRTIVYKGMLTPAQVGGYYIDLASENYTAAIALVHSRFSTNTLPSWSRAQPLRCIAHNGEINTLRGNSNWMNAREHKLRSDLFGDDLKKTLHIIDGEASDSGAFDNSLEMLKLAGRSLPHAMMMMIPEPLSEQNAMSRQKRAFYEYHSYLLEAWDGPAAITFTDGDIIGAVLDRNGLRPSRYYVTADGRVVMASEVGVLDVEPAGIIEKGRLQPGKMFLVDTLAGRIIDDDEIKRSIAGEHPYGEWIEKHLLHIDALPAPPFVNDLFRKTITRRQNAFGYTDEDVRTIIVPMALNGEEAIGSMGSDTPLAVLSKKPQLLYNYFKQLFAQVTNPPIDAIREELVISTDTAIGPDDNLFEPTENAVRQIKLNSFILTNEELEKLRLLGDSESDWGKTGFRSITLPMLFDRSRGENGLEEALERLCRQASAAVEQNYDIFILSDRDLSSTRVPIPALLAVSAVHHHLIREGTRTQVGFVLESGEPREVHHFALLLGYGATAINPYLAFETIQDRIRSGFDETDEFEAIKNYRKAVTKGVVKVMSKMGISTIRGYCGAQIFESIGIADEVIDKYFAGTPARLGGLRVKEIAAEAIARHEAAFAGPAEELSAGGVYQFRADGELHLFEPASVHALQRACRDNDADAFRQYSSSIDRQRTGPVTLRSMLRFKNDLQSVPLTEVEPIEQILRRFKTGAMSYGSISSEAHEALAVAMNRIGGKSNTGEGGEDAERYLPNKNGDRRRSAIKQVASGRFGVTSHYLVNADEIQIKMAQGAKPGEGGQLPGSKVYPWIAKTRHSTPGVGLISPPPHHDIYSIEDLKQLIYDLKNANDKARISVKLVAEAGVGTIAAGVAKAKADVIVISGHDGGTGASPLTGIRHAGIPWEIGLAEAQQTLVMNGLRTRVRLETDGQLRTGRDVVIAALLGAEEFAFATAPLVTLGCIMMRVCHLNTCPVGIATQDPQLRSKYSGDPQFAVNFMMFVAAEVRELMAELGFRNLDELIGKAGEVLEFVPPPEHPKAALLDLSAMLLPPEPNVPSFNQIGQEHELEQTFDRRVLFDICRPALETAEPVFAVVTVKNTDRAVGTAVGSEISRRFGSEGLPGDTIRLTFKGSAGQSFGAFVPRGMTLTVVGDANDYFGKGLSGGDLVVHPPYGSTFEADQNVIIGNTALYGATSGTAFINGLAGERFAVRNSGAIAVAEGVGDHGCEYMTGGRVVVLGRTGKNFAAGMSGGIAYVYDEDDTFAIRCNREMVKLGPVEEEDELVFVRKMVERHYELTQSRRAERLLTNWAATLNKLVRIMPKEYERALERSVSADIGRGLSADEIPVGSAA